MADWFTFSKKKIDKNTNLLSYLYSQNLNVPDISFQPLNIYVNSLVKKTPIRSHTHSAAQYNIMIGHLGTFCLDRGPSYVACGLPINANVYTWRGDVIMSWTINVSDMHFTVSVISLLKGFKGWFVYIFKKV